MAYVVAAINFNGPYYLDSNGMVYLPEKRITSLLWANKDVVGRGVFHSSETTKDDKLFTTHVYGKLNLTDPLQVCADYVTSMKFPDGSYELVLKFMEFYYSELGERQFSVLVNNVTIISNLDILSLVDKYEPLELVVRILIKNNQKWILIDGWSWAPFHHGKVIISFCKGTLLHTDGNFLLSAAYIGKFLK